MTPVDIKKIDLEAQKRRKKSTFADIGEVPPEPELELGEVPEFIPKYVSPPPEKAEPVKLPPIEDDIFSIVGRVFPELLDPTRSYGYTPEELPGVAVDTVASWATQDPDMFVDYLRDKGRNADTEALLRAFEAPDDLIDAIFAPVALKEVAMPQSGVYPVDGIRKLVTIDPNTGMAYDQNGNRVGSFDPISKQITTTPPESKAKDIWDAAVLSAASIWHRTKQYFVSSLPNLLFRDMTAAERAIQGDEWADVTDARNRALRDKFRQVYARNKVEFDTWVEKNPELQPKIEYQEGVLEHPDLLKDPYYYAYEIASAVPFMAGVMATAIATTAATGNPLLGLTAGMVVATPSQTQDVYEALLENGATEEQATLIANPVGAVISAVEVLGDIPFFKAVAPQFFKFFRKEATEEIAKQTMKGLIKKGITTAATVEIAETMEEVVQQALQNAAIKVVNEHQDIFEGLTDTAIRAAIASAPFALFGGGAASRNVLNMPEVQQAMAKVKEERGSFRFFPEEKPVTPEVKFITIEERAGGYQASVISDKGVKVPIGDLSITLEKARASATKILSENLDLLEKDWAKQGHTFQKAAESIKAPALPKVVTPENYVSQQTEGKTLDEIGKLRTDIATKKEVQLNLKRQYGEGFVDDVVIQLDKRIAELRGEPLPKAEVGMPEAVKPPAKAEVTPAPEVEVVKAQVPQVTREIETVVSDLQATIERTSEELKGQRGEAARIGRETLKGLEREAAYAQKTLDSFKGQINVPEATVLRSTIAAMSKFKGLPKKQLQDIISGVAGKRRLSNLPSPQLADILEKVREARPVRIGGNKVVTLKTEKKIQSLKASLVSSRQMTNEIYEHLKERLNLNTDRYEYAHKFISETEAKDLIMAMNDEVVLAKWDIKVQDSLAKNPDIKEVRDRLNDRGMTGTGVEFDGKPIKISRGTELHSMRYYVLNLQKKLAAPIYDAWQKINSAHLVARDRHNQQLRRLQETTPNFGEVVADDVALKRIEDYIASKRNLAKIKAPELSEDELAIATELERRYFGGQDRVRFNRFTNAYAENEGDIDLIAKEIPNAPKAALRRAIDVYEGKGADELRKFTDTQKWGVKGSGYDPASYIKPILYLRAPKETTFAKGLLRTREGVEYQDDETNIIQRYARHEKQLIALEEMSSLVRAFGRLYSEHATKLAPSTQRDVSKVLSRGINELKGYREDGGAIVHAIERLYGQVASAVFWRPDLVARNKFQNFAFNPDFWAGRFLDPRNKAISESRRRWFEVFVSQERVFQYDFLLYGEKPIPGFGRITKWARRTSLYPWSDKSNRAEAFYVRINRVDRALQAYDKDGNVQKLIDDSGLNEFEPRQQAEALELLAMDKVDYGIDGMDAVTGREAFALYNSQQLVNNVHFLYDRAQRAPAEMGATGKTLGNILVFNRSWGERFILQARKLSPESKATLKERMKAVTVIVGVMVAGTLAGETYKKITGKEHNPYNPLNIITWAPGGLALGVTEDISNTIYLMTQAVQGDKSAFASIPGVLANVATLTLPFYKNAIQALDAITDMKRVDVYAMRKIREMIDEEYEVRGGVHEVERTLLEKLQRAIFSLKDDPVTPQEKIEESESILGMDIDMGDVAFTLEEPDIHDMGKLNTDLSRILANVKPEEITKENGYSELAVARLDKERYEAIWDTMPHKKIYEITELPEELAKWANRNKRKLALVAQYSKLEGAEAKAFLDAHLELKENPSIEWLKRFPMANAQLALWGQTKIYSIEAYDEFNRLIKDLDIPDDAIPELTLPPKGSVENYFKYQDMLTDFAPNSWEVQYLMTQDDELRQFLKRDPVETPVRSLELKIQHRPLYDLRDSFSDKDSSAYIKDDKAREEAIKQLKADNPQWVDDMRRIEAIENAASDETIESWVKRGNVIDQFSAGSSEAMVWLLDNPEIHKWAIDNELLTDDGSDWNEPVLRINAKWRESDDKYLGYGDETSEFYIKDDVARIAARDKLLTDDNYRMDRRRREASGAIGPAGEKFSDNQVEQFVGYWELPVKGFRQERYLLDNPDFANAMHTINGIDLPKATEVPSAKYDDIYEKHQANFDKLAGLSDNKSPYYIENEAMRADARNALRYDARGNLTDFGKAEIRLEAYAKFIPDNHVDTYVNYYSLPATGYRQERMLAENQSFYKEVWLGILKNDRIDLRDVPDKQYDDIYDKHKDLFDKWDDYKDPDSPLYIDNADDRRDARQALLDGNPKFAEDRIRREAYSTLVGHEEFVEDLVAYRLLPGEGYEDDWFLMENPEFRKVLSKALGWEIKDFSKVPTREVFRLYEIYQNIEGSRDRMNYRVSHPDLDKWGQLRFGWKPAIEQVDISQASKEDIIYAITRLSDMSDEEKARIEGMSLEDILDSLDKTFQAKIQAFLNRGSLTTAEKEALKRMEEEGERAKERKTIDDLLAEMERKLKRLTK